MANRTPFSLIELLVVLMILLVLVSLLQPALMATLHASRKIGCQKNLNQIGQGLLMYTDEYYHILPKIWDGNRNWVQRTDVYCDNQQRFDRGVWACPAEPEPDISSPFVSYGFSGYYSQRNITKIHNPQKTLIVGDCNVPTSTNPRYLKGWYYMKPIPVGDGKICPRHQGFGNLVFGDGHVEARLAAPLNQPDYEVYKALPWDGNRDGK